MVNRIIAAVFLLALMRIAGGLWFHTAVKQAVRKAQSERRSAAEPTEA